MYKFFQDFIFRGHVADCTKRRSESTSKIDQDGEKLASNVVFGKSSEQILNRSKIEYYNDFNKLYQASNTQKIKDFKIIKENLVQVTFQQSVVKINRPIYLGFSVLDISKQIVIDFFYNVLLKKFSKLKCVYSDTDSYYLEIKGYTEDRIFSKLSEHLDFSNFPSNHPRFNNSKKFKLGFLKVDTSAKVIHAFVAIRKKNYMYSTNLPTEKSERVVKLKGIKKSSFQQVSLDDYKRTVLNGCVSRVNLKKIEKSKHKLYFSEQRKVALNSFDASSMYKDCGICTTSYVSRCKNAEICSSIDCKIKKLLLRVWSKI